MRGYSSARNDSKDSFTSEPIACGYEEMHRLTSDLWIISRVDCVFTATAGLFETITTQPTLSAMIV
jgi:hypothetical protein